MRLKNFLTVACATLILSATVASAVAAPVVGPSTTWTTGPGANNHLYVMYNDSAGIQFLAANTFANSLTLPGYGPGRLASITTANEQTFLHNFNVANGAVSWWAGGTDLSTLGTTANEWIWTDGSGNFWDQGGAGNPQNGLFAQWNAGEPNGGGDGEYALEIQSSGNWNDLSTQSLNRFIVEFVQQVPEPASVAIWSLIGVGIAGFGIYRVRRAQVGAKK